MSIQVSNPDEVPGYQILSLGEELHDFFPERYCYVPVSKREEYNKVAGRANAEYGQAIDSRLLRWLVRNGFTKEGIPDATA